MNSATTLFVMLAALAVVAMVVFLSREIMHLRAQSDQQAQALQSTVAAAQQAKEAAAEAAAEASAADDTVAVLPYSLNPYSWYYGYPYQYYYNYLPRYAYTTGWRRGGWGGRGWGGGRHGGRGR
jgi:hypothetical protein